MLSWDVNNGVRIIFSYLNRVRIIILGTLFVTICCKITSLYTFEFQGTKINS